MLDVPSGLADLPGVYAVEVTDHRVTAQVDTAGLGPLMHSLTAAGLRSLVSHPPTLEELFLRQYGAAEEPDAGMPTSSAGDTERSQHV